MSRVILLLVILFFFQGCSSYNPKPADIAEGKVIEAFKEEMKDKYNMQVIGSGGGSDNGLWLLKLSLNIRKPIDLYEARRLIIITTETLLRLVNQNEELRPYLKNYPFTEKNLEVTIFSYKTPDLETGSYYDPNISVVNSLQGNVIFKTEEKGNKFGYKEVIKETYQKALEIVKNEGTLNLP